MNSCCKGIEIGNIYSKYPELKGEKIMLFKALPGFDGVNHEFGGKIYTFYENKTTEAPEALQIHEYTIQKVTDVIKEKIIDTSTEYLKKGDK